MKVHYTNILLLYAVNLSILLITCHINIQKNHYINVLHTSNTTKIPTTRLLCECDLYTSIYDNDPEMKAVMQQFDRQTSQRFEEYNERMQEKRQTCKEQCEKDIQKIILKDKIEKELTEKFATLQTDITTEDIPTCVCEKSVADKVENICLKCGGLLGGGVAPSLGLLGEIGGLLINNWTNTPFFKAFVTFAEKKGLAAGAKAGDAAGVDKVIELVNSKFGVSTLADKALESFFTVQNYSQEDLITESLYFEFKATCLTSASENDSLLCFYGRKSGFVPGTSVSPRDVIGTTVKEIVKKSTNAATQAADTAATETTNGLIEAEISKITSAGANLYTAIVYSVTAILIIVLVMVIIYLILRYRRKKKMKKKLQYIKLLKE
ncbi:rifin [Plasmodium falciparum IGH-CR14]|uniref:Rifin n=1 Tax=Plasmodium falciparum IGH-CR14 TaxID=580059 RepID=A0A0L1I2Z7_PLAFA|nr:rifin [Plasmodium falciparum IGH-CR14]